MAMVQCVLAVLVAAGVAVQPEAPVRRHRAQGDLKIPVRRQPIIDEPVEESPDEPDEEALDEANDYATEEDLGGRGGKGKNRRKERKRRRKRCRDLSKKPPSGIYIVGPCGQDKCPSGYNPITNVDECKAAAGKLGLPWYVPTMVKIGKEVRKVTSGWNRGSNRQNVCNYCGGCGKKDGNATVRIDDNHFHLANFICTRPAVDCVWTTGAWTTCSNSCGSGTKTRSVKKTTTEAYGGTCATEPDSSQSCNNGAARSGLVDSSGAAGSSQKTWRRRPTAVASRQLTMGIRFHNHVAHRYGTRFAIAACRGASK